jgi:predicted RND superfamily exporter protein
VVLLILGLLNYEITVLTALVPSLIIVIEFQIVFSWPINTIRNKIHHNKAKALQRVTTKVGMATLMTNLTTAIGFLLLCGFKQSIIIRIWVVTSINIYGTFFVHYCDSYFHSYIPHQKNAISNTWSRLCKGFMGWILRNVKYNRFTIYVVSIVLLVISIIGIMKCVLVVW